MIRAEYLKLKWMKTMSLKRMSDEDLETAIVSAVNDKDNKQVYKLVDRLLEEKSRRKRLREPS